MRGLCTQQTNQCVLQEERRLRHDLFGTLKPLEWEEYKRIHDATGLDVDGRKQKLLSCVESADKPAEHFIGFCQDIPGFSDLPPEDQMRILTGELHFVCEIAHLVFDFDPNLWSHCDHQPRKLTFSGNMFYFVTMLDYPYCNTHDKIFTSPLKNRSMGEDGNEPSRFDFCMPACHKLFSASRPQCFPLVELLLYCSQDDVDCLFKIMERLQSFHLNNKEKALLTTIMLLRPGASVIVLFLRSEFVQITRANVRLTFPDKRRTYSVALTFQNTASRQLECSTCGEQRRC